MEMMQMVRGFINLIKANPTTREQYGRSQNTVPIASTQVAIKGTVQYSTRASERADSQQLATRHSREHTLSAVSPDAPVE